MQEDTELLRLVAIEKAGTPDTPDTPDDGGDP
jgi:hypothetical protein